MTAAETPSADFRRTARDAYRPIVERLKPSCSGSELDLRCSIFFLRDAASSHMRCCSEEAYGLNREIVGLASSYCLTSMSLNHLRELRHILGRLTLSGRAVEQLVHELGCPARNTLP